MTCVEEALLGSFGRQRFGDRKVDAIKLIPQLFFDLIARVVPGVVTLILLVWLMPECEWSCMLNATAGGKLTDNNAFAFAFFIPLGAGFVIGHLIAPLGKWLRTATQRAALREPWRNYDWLRVHRPDAGALAAKIRAEYTMHFSLAAAFLLGFAGALAMRWLGYAPKSWIETAVLFLLTALALYRGHETAKTFATSVGHLYDVAIEEIPEIVPPKSDGGIR